MKVFSYFTNFFMSVCFFYILFIPAVFSSQLIKAKRPHRASMLQRVRLNLWFLGLEQDEKVDVLSKLGENPGDEEEVIRYPEEINRILYKI